MIRHSVVFRLKHSKGSPKEREFLLAACALASLPMVRNFECLRQVSRKNNFDFGLSMEFATVADYSAYEEHPEHRRFIETLWLVDVAEFIEIDFEAISPR